MDDWGEFREPTEDERRSRRIMALAISLINANRPLTTTEIRRDLYPDFHDDNFKKTFQRDRARLSSTGLVIEKAKGHKRGEEALWHVDEEHSFVSESKLSQADALMLDFLLLPIASNPSFPYAQDLRLALTKIDRSFDGSSQISVSPDARQRSNVLARIEACLAQLHAARIRYHRADGSCMERTVAPYGMFSLRDSTYLVAARAGEDASGDDEDKAPHTYNLSRVDAVREMPRIRYEVPADFDVRDFIKLPFQIGDIRYTAAFARADAKDESEMGTTRREPVHDTSIAAAWAIAHSLKPLEPLELVNAWNDLLCSTLDVISYDNTVFQQLDTYVVPNSYYSNTSNYFSIIQCNTDTKSNNFPKSQHHFSSNLGKTRTTRNGRQETSAYLRELAALLGSLSQAGATISVQAVSDRLGISAREAHDMMELMCQAHGEETNGLLISCNDDETEYTLQYPGTRGRPLRLTKQETIAVLHALDVAGVSADSTLHEHLSQALTSPEVTRDQVRRALGTPVNDPAVAMCARAQAEGRSVRFGYLGLKDTVSRQRQALVRSLRAADSGWLMLGFDLDCRQERTFRTDRMSEIALGPEIEPDFAQNTVLKSETRVITFTNPLYYHAFAWPTLSVFSQVDSCITGTIAYYGERSMWLERRIAACGGTVFVNDDDIMSRAREYAASLLRPTS